VPVTIHELAIAYAGVGPSTIDISVSMMRTTNSLFGSRMLDTGVQPCSVWVVEPPIGLGSAHTELEYGGSGSPESEIMGRGFT
jgi:hypothetical protein